MLRPGGRPPSVVTSRRILLGAARSPGFVNLSSKSPKASGSEKHADALRHLFHAAAGQPADAPCRELARPRSVQRLDLGATVGDRPDAGRDRLPHRGGAPLRFPCDAEGALSARGRTKPRHRSPTPSPNSPASAEPFVIPRLAIGQIDRFFALLPASPLPALNRLADDVVKAFDRFRSPLTEAEIERRNPDSLSAEEFRNLCQWGYPYVFDAFRFHMTLTGRVGEPEAGRVRAALDEVFGSTLAGPVPVDGIALFVEPEAGCAVHDPLLLPLRAAARKKDCLKCLPNWS